MKVRHETNLIRSHFTIFFIMYKSQTLVKVKNANSEKMKLLHLIRNGGNRCYSREKRVSKL